MVNVNNIRINKHFKRIWDNESIVISNKLVKKIKKDFFY